MVSLGHPGMGLEDSARAIETFAREVARAPRRAPP